MATTPKSFVQGVQIANAQTTQYTSTAVRSILDKCTVTNTTGSAATLTINLVPSGGAAAANNTIISARSVAAGECYTCPEIVGHVLNPGDFFSTLSGTNNALTLRVSGREVT